jgi:uncharacterized flavoprotein (TIGR03862 family)
MAAEVLAEGGAQVHVFDAMPSVGRKLLMAGKSGLNLTHGEPLDRFLDRFDESRDRIAPMVTAFGPAEIRSWAAALGVETFAGSSGRVFPVDFKAAPLLRNWIRRLRAAGVRFHVRHRWVGWTDSGDLRFETPDGFVDFAPKATVLALGGASWPQLGSDGAWAARMRAHGVEVAPFRPANAGFDVGWSEHFRTRFAGQPVKPVILTSPLGSQRGEFIVSESGIEGSGVYAHSAALRDRIEAEGAAILTIDLAPDWSIARLVEALGKPRGSRSLAEHLRRGCGITGVKAGLLRECLNPGEMADLQRLAQGIKALPLKLTATRPIEEAISSAGGITWDSLSDDLMIRALPGVFAAGEMLDWEVTTGGYLLTACFATGRTAGAGALEWLAHD